MIKSVKLLIFLILFLIPGFVCAKEFNATVSKPISFAGGSSLINYGKVDEDFVNRLKKINVASTSSFEVNKGSSGATYYDNYHTPGNYPFGIYAIPTPMGTYNNLDFSILYSKLLVVGDKSYDVKLKVNSVFDEEDGAIVFVPNRIVTTLDEYFVSEKNTNN